MQPFRYHVIVCTQQKPENVPACAAANAGAVLDALYGQLGQQGLSDDVIVSTTGCLGACEHGSVMIVYPDATWYGAVKPADVAEIVASHLKGGKPVARLALTEEAALRAEILEHRKQFFGMLAARDKAGILPENISLHEILRGYTSSRALLTALELDIFTAVGTGASASEIAAKIHTDRRATEMLLNVLVAMKLLAKNGDAFQNTPITARFLSGDSKDNARPGLMHNVHLWDTWSTLTDCVRRGTSVAQSPLTGREESTRAFIAAMDNNAKERAGQVVRAVGNGFKRMLDLGGGSGAYSIAFAQANPQVHVDLLDQPSVLPLTQEYIRRAGLEARVQTLAGDLHTDSFPEGYDLVLLSQIAHSFSPEENRNLLGRIYQSLVPGGRLVLQDFILEADKTSPVFAALFSLNMLVNTAAGSSYSELEYDAWLRGAGFRETTRVRMPGPANLMIATK